MKKTRRSLESIPSGMGRKDLSKNLVVRSKTTGKVQFRWKSKNEFWKHASMTIVVCSRNIIILTSKHFSKNVKTPGVVIGICAVGFQKKTFFRRFPLNRSSSRQKVVPSPVHTSPFRQIKRVSVSGDTATSGNDIMLCARAAVFPRHRPNRCCSDQSF